MLHVGRKRSIRELYPKQRVEGRNALDCLFNHEILVIATAYFVGAANAPIAARPALIGLAFLKYLMYILRNITIRTIPRPIERNHVTIEGIDYHRCRIDYRFKKEHLHAVMTCLDIPPVFILANGSVVPGEEAFLFVLARLVRCSRLSDLELEFGIRDSVLSLLFNAVVTRIVQANYDLLYNNLVFFAHRFALYNAAIRKKAASFLPDDHPLPAAALRTAVFTDGTRIRIARPSDDLMQLMCFNGKDHVHCLEFQKTEAPDGMIVDLFGPIPGSRHDAYIHRISELKERLIDCQVGRYDPMFASFEDRAYVTKACCIAAFRGRNLPLVYAISNWIMNKLRTPGAEWGFGRTLSSFPLCDAYKQMKLLQSPVANYYIVAALLTNCYTCLYGSNTSKFFGIRPPTLAEYFYLDDIAV